MVDLVERVLVEQVQLVGLAVRVRLVVQALLAHLVELVVWVQLVLLVVQVHIVDLQALVLSISDQVVFVRMNLKLLAFVHHF